MLAVPLFAQLFKNSALVPFTDTTWVSREPTICVMVKVE